ncbi:hypothetical protein R3P38DRAFT_3191100 [Favolaschia claudopus]|uniref:Uncharacterized protein n=1 Tax=Favolaschia claudopus TaxID=2862362 RepID=A0AAW0BKP9_9AGAR
MAARVKANALHIKSNLTFDCLIQAEVRNGVVREIGDLKAGQMRMFPLADIEGCAVGEILNVKARTIPGQLENPLEVVSPVEIEFSGSANGVARFIIGYDATPGLTIDLDASELRATAVRSEVNGRMDTERILGHSEHVKQDRSYTFNPFAKKLDTPHNGNRTRTQVQFKPTSQPSDGVTSSRMRMRRRQSPNNSPHSHHTRTKSSKPPRDNESYQQPSGDESSDWEDVDERLPPNPPSNVPRKWNPWPDGKWEATYSREFYEDCQFAVHWACDSVAAARLRLARLGF